MRRFLFGFVFSMALFMAGTASALIMTSGEVPVNGHKFWNGQIHQNFGELVATDIQLDPLRRTVPSFGRTDFHWLSSPPFEWPDTEWLRELDAWKGEFPFLANFPLDCFGDWHERIEDRLGDPVPEPSTALLFGAGMLGLGLVGRRRD